jgi:hypothetical protein
VFSDFKLEQAVQFLTVDQVKNGTEHKPKDHLGVGPNVAWADFGMQNYFPSYGAQPNEKTTTCLYNSVMTFSITGSIMKLELDNKGQTYYKALLRVVVMVLYDLNTGGLKHGYFEQVRIVCK